jgi:hypothetical protein
MPHDHLRNVIIASMEIFLHYLKEKDEMEEACNIHGNKKFIQNLK